MRHAHAAAVLIIIAATPAYADCKDEVRAAFEKQRHQSAYRVVTQMPVPAGKATIKVDYVPPDRMHQTVVAPGQSSPLETIAVERWVWGNQGAGWEELQPQFAQPVTAGVREALVDPIEATADFTCLGTVTYQGQSYLGYREKAGAGTPAPPDRGVGGSDKPRAALDRTVYIDPATGLPAYNIIAEAGAADQPVVQNAFSYDASIKVEAPANAAPAPISRPH